MSQLLQSRKFSPITQNMMGVAGCLTLAFASNASAGEWLSGAQFQQQLQAPIGLAWEATPLRDGLQNLGESQRLAIFLDRRVDPGQPVTFSATSAPVERALRQLARQQNLGVGFVGPVIYIGPPLTCRRLATLAEFRNEQAKQLASAAHRRLLRRSPLQWPELSEPRPLIASVASSAGIAIVNLEKIPHDLWRAGELPPLTLPEKLTLLLAGFEMSFRLDPNATEASLVRFPRAVALERRYRFADPQARMAEFQTTFPQAFLRIDAQTQELVVRSTLEDHWQIQQPARHNDTGGADRSGGDTGAAETNQRSDQRYTLNVENQAAGKLVRLLSERLSLELQIDEDVSREQLEMLVSVSVVEATQDELLNAIASPAYLKARVVGGVMYLSQK